MLSENIKAAREARGLSQEELAIKVNVVRQTVSKWERGLSVPDADMLVSVAEALDTPVSALLGERISIPKADDVTALAERLEVINLQLVRKKEARRKAARCAFAAVGIATILGLACFAVMGSSYLNWNFNDPETAVAGTAVHAFEWIFVRVAPFLLAGSIAGLYLTRDKS